MPTFQANDIGDRLCSGMRPQKTAVNCRLRGKQFVGLSGDQSLSRVRRWQAVGRASQGCGR